MKPEETSTDEKHEKEREATLQRAGGRWGGGGTEAEIPGQDQ